MLPEIIYGDEVPPAIKPEVRSNILKGIPSSRGYYRGPIKVIQSIAEFHKLVPGDVLVIPFSDVSWTPLFTHAGAVIASWRHPFPQLNCSPRIPNPGSRICARRDAFT